MEETEEINYTTIVENINHGNCRFSSATWYEEAKKKSIILAGVGGIGSWCALLLSRVTPAALFLYDNDIVDASNMSGQLYSIENIGKYKVDALADTIRKYSNYHSVFSVEGLYDENSEAGDIMICGFDSITARKLFFNKWKEHVMAKPEEERKNCLFIDGRLSTEEFQIFCITGNDDYNIGRYEREFLFHEHESAMTICSYKQTTFSAAMIASFMVNLYINFCTDLCSPQSMRSIPFFTYYDASFMNLTSEM